MASEPGFLLFEELLHDYDNRKFLKDDGSMDLTPNTITITNSLIPKGLTLDNKKQTIDGFTLYPKDYFCPKNYETGKIEFSNNTYTIHHFSGSWMPANEKRKRDISDFVKKILGSRLAQFIINIKRNR